MRKASIERNTKETSISMDLNLEGNGELTGKNPIPFFEHMLNHLCKYSLFSIDLQLEGDLSIDAHHSVEDTAIVLGMALEKALGDKKGIFRYGTFSVPMDETLTSVTIDLSGRPYFRYTGPNLTDMGKLGNYDSELTIEFLQKLSIHAAMNLHVQVHYGENRHHIHESIFKCLGFALRQAVSIDKNRKNQIPSTKGTL